MPKVLTANRLVDGEVVWFGSGRWLETLDGSHVADTAKAIEALKSIAERDVAANLVIDAGLIDVERTEGEVGAGTSCGLNITSFE